MYQKLHAANRYQGDMLYIWSKQKCSEGCVGTKRKGRDSYLSIGLSCKGRILNGKRVLSRFFRDAGSPLFEGTVSGIWVRDSGLKPRDAGRQK